MAHITDEEIEELVTEIRQFHAELVEMDGGECRATAMYREAADTIDSLLPSLKQSRAEVADLQTRIIGLESLLCDAQAEVESAVAEIDLYKVANERLRAEAERLHTLERVARNYVECARGNHKSPFVEENGILGHNSPWSELCSLLQPTGGRDG